MSYNRFQKETDKKKTKEKEDPVKKSPPDKKRTEKMLKKYKGKLFSDDEE
jgi:hypothetical protein